MNDNGIKYALSAEYFSGNVHWDFEHEFVRCIFFREHGLKVGGDYIFKFQDTMIYRSVEIVDKRRCLIRDHNKRIIDLLNLNMAPRTDVKFFAYKKIQ